MVNLFCLALNSMELRKEKEDEFLQYLRQSIEAGTFVKLTLSKPGVSGSSLQNVYARLVELKEQEMLSFTLRHATKDMVKKSFDSRGHRHGRVMDRK